MPGNHWAVIWFNEDKWVFVDFWSTVKAVTLQTCFRPWLYHSVSVWIWLNCTASLCLIPSFVKEWMGRLKVIGKWAHPHYVLRVGFLWLLQEYFFSQQSLSSNLPLTIWLDWLASETQGSPCICFSRIADAGHCAWHSGPHVYVVAIWSAEACPQSPNSAFQSKQFYYSHLLCLKDEIIHTHT